MSKYFEICPTSKTTFEDIQLMNKYINTKFCINPETGSISMLKDAEFEGLSYTSCVHDTDNLDNLIRLCGLLYLGRLQKCCEMECHEPPA